MRPALERELNVAGVIFQRQHAAGDHDEPIFGHPRLQQVVDLGSNPMAMNVPARGKMAEESLAFAGFQRSPQRLGHGADAVDDRPPVAPLGLALRGFGPDGLQERSRSRALGAELQLRAGRGRLMAAGQETVARNRIDDSAMAPAAGFDDDVNSRQARANQGNRLIDSEPFQEARSPRIGRIAADGPLALDAGRVLRRLIAHRQHDLVGDDELSAFGSQLERRRLVALLRRSTTSSRNSSIGTAP